MVSYLHTTPRFLWSTPTFLDDIMSTRFVTAEQLLGRMLDPTDPEAALRQEVELHGVEGVLEEAKRWLREGEELDSSFEADVRLAVSVFERPSTQRD